MFLILCLMRHLGRAMQKMGLKIFVVVILKEGYPAKSPFGMNIVPVIPKENFAEDLVPANPSFGMTLIRIKRLFPGEATHLLYWSL